MSAPKLTCDVCKQNEALGVASSALGPISWAYCAECNRQAAEPACMFEYLFDHVSDNGDGLAEHVNHYSTFISGAYRTWPEYREERRKARGTEPSGCGGGE